MPVIRRKPVFRHVPRTTLAETEPRRVLSQEYVLTCIKNEIDMLLWPAWSEKHQQFYKMLIDVVAHHKDRYKNYCKNREEIPKLQDNVSRLPWFNGLPRPTRQRILQVLSSMELVKEAEDRKEGEVDDTLILRFGHAFLVADSSDGSITWSTENMSISTVSLPANAFIVPLTAKIREPHDELSPDYAKLQRIFVGALGITGMRSEQMLDITKEILLFYDIHV